MNYTAQVPITPPIWITALARRLTWMLDVDEHAAAVGRHCCTCNFAARGSGEEAADLARRDVGGEHLVSGRI